MEIFYKVAIGSLFDCAYLFKVLLCSFSFSIHSDFIFGKNAPCQLLRLNLKNKTVRFFNYDFLFNCPPLPDSVPVEFHWERWIETESDVIYLWV